MIKITDKSRCTGCHACTSICPQNCIKMTQDEEGFLYPAVDYASCIDCGLCENICPILNPKNNDNTFENIYAYAAHTKNESIRMESSSGGIFSEIASYVISQGGVVFGAAFDDVLQVRHICVEHIEELWKLRGSKYVQSIIGDAYRGAERYLKQGRLVLFTGTPCQIGGLYSYLRHMYENLITQDIICHGVPSPLVWEKYITYREKAAASKIQKAFFRNKKYGWKMYSVQFKFLNCTEYLQRFDKDPYMKSFLENLDLRPSCYACAFKNKIRQSDITLADFWGIQNLMPEADDDKGTSLLIINSIKGDKLIKNVKNNLIFWPADFEKAIYYNSSITKAAELPPSRSAFFEDLKEKDFHFMEQKYLKIPFIKKVKSKIKNMLKSNMK